MCLTSRHVCLSARLSMMLCLAVMLNVRGSPRIGQGAERSQLLAGWIYLISGGWPRRSENGFRMDDELILLFFFFILCPSYFVLSPRLVHFSNRPRTDVVKEEAGLVSEFHI